MSWVVANLFVKMEFVHPEREWKVEGSLFAKQSDMDMRIKWREGVNREVYIH